MGVVVSFCLLILVAIGVSCEDTVNSEVEENTYTYTVKDMAADLQLVLYRKIDTELGYDLEMTPANEVDGPGNESLVYVVSDTLPYIDVHIQVESPVGAETSYWLVKTVE